MRYVAGTASVILAVGYQQPRGRLKALARAEDLKACVLAIDNPSGPVAYKVAREADVTVVLYNIRNVKANFAFRKGELNDQAIEKVVGALSKVVP
jgi:hypothetical protein